MSTAEREMEWSGMHKLLGHRQFVGCASPLMTTLATTSAATRGITLCSGPDQAGKTHLNEMSG